MHFSTKPAPSRRVSTKLVPARQRQRQRWVLVSLPVDDKFAKLFAIVQYDSMVTPARRRLARSAGAGGAVRRGTNITNRVNSQRVSHTNARLRVTQNGTIFQCRLTRN